MTLHLENKGQKLETNPRTHSYEVKSLRLCHLQCSKNMSSYFRKNLKLCVLFICLYVSHVKTSEEHTTHDSLRPYQPLGVTLHVEKNGSSWKRTLAVIVMRWKVYLLQRSTNISSCFRKNLESKTLKTLFCWKWSAQLFIPTRMKNKKLLRIIFYFSKGWRRMRQKICFRFWSGFFPRKLDLTNLSDEISSTVDKFRVLRRFVKTISSFEFYWERSRTFF